jgi:pimeloyl-ACP methyl ester carboxylesterase
MNWIRRGWYWYVDYWFVSWWQFRHFVRGKDLGELATGTKAPVLLLPGVYETWQFLRPIAERLHADGHPIHVLTNLGYNRQPIPDASALASRYLQAHDLTGVLIVAHSKGGLIGKHLMAIGDTERRVDRMVAVATPFAGSIYAKYIPVRTIRVFSPVDQTIALLGANLAINGRITSIFGDFDPHIPGGSHLEGATNVQLPVIGHFRILRDERVIAEVCKALEGSQTA